MAMEKGADDLFSRLETLRIAADTPVRVGGWAFRGLLNPPVRN
jgi:hypothetical protein